MASVIAKPVCHRTTACVLAPQQKLSNSYETLISAEMTVLGTYFEFIYEPLSSVSSGTA